MLTLKKYVMNFKNIMANKTWSHMAAKAQPAKPTLAATSSMQTVLDNFKIT